MLTIFFDTSQRLRSGWRIVIYFLIAVLLMLIFSTAEMLFGLSSEPLTGDLYTLTATNITSVLALTIAAFAAQKFFERLPPTAFGLAFEGRWLTHLLIGAITGTLAIGASIAVPFISGHVKFAINDTAPTGDILRAVITAFGVLAGASLFEEVLMRGYVFQTLVRSDLTWLGIVLTSVIFGVMHLGNPNVTFFSTTNTILVGILFCAAYLRSRDLWLPWGFHLFWNWVQGSVFGIEISGLRFLTPISILNENDLGPNWLTGGTYGIEGSVFCSISLCLTILAIWFLPIFKRGKREEENVI